MSKMRRPTPGAFGKQADPNAPKRVNLIVRKLTPPPQAMKKIIVDDNKREIRNPIKRFIAKFFGEGF